MFKFVTLSVLFALTNGQYLLNHGLNNRFISTTGHHHEPQYVLVQAQPQESSHLHISPYITRQAYSIAAPQTVVAAPAPRIIARAPVARPVVVQAPRVVQTARVVEEQYAPAEPYTFGFQSSDEQGNTMSRTESSDGSGAVRGSYSYTDANGLNRLVEYIADAAGYRATVKTNEPGTANANPADVQISAEESPPAVQQIVAAYSAPRTKVQ